MAFNSTFEFFSRTRRLIHWAGRNDPGYKDNLWNGFIKDSSHAVTALFPIAGLKNLVWNSVDYGHFTDTTLTYDGTLTVLAPPFAYVDQTSDLSMSLQVFQVKMSSIVTAMTTNLSDFWNVMFSAIVSIDAHLVYLDRKVFSIDQYVNELGENVTTLSIAVHEFISSTNDRFEGIINALNGTSQAKDDDVLLRWTKLGLEVVAGIAGMIVMPGFGALIGPMVIEMVFNTAEGMIQNYESGNTEQRFFTVMSALITLNTAVTIAKIGSLGSKIGVSADGAALRVDLLTDGVAANGIAQADAEAIANTVNKNGQLALRTDWVTSYSDSGFGRLMAKYAPSVNIALETSIGVSELGFRGAEAIRTMVEGSSQTSGLLNKLTKGGTLTQAEAVTVTDDVMSSLGVKAKATNLITAVESVNTVVEVADFAAQSATVQANNLQGLYDLASVLKRWTFG
jgi:hypothetical protein